MKLQKTGMMTTDDDFLIFTFSMLDGEHWVRVRHINISSGKEALVELVLVGTRSRSSS